MGSGGSSDELDRQQWIKEYGGVREWVGGVHGGAKENKEKREEQQSIHLANMCMCKIIWLIQAKM